MKNSEISEENLQWYLKQSKDILYRLKIHQRKSLREFVNMDLGKHNSIVLVIDGKYRDNPFVWRRRLFSSAIVKNVIKLIRFPFHIMYI